MQTTKDRLALIREKVAGIEHFIEHNPALADHLTSMIVSTDSPTHMLACPGTVEERAQIRAATFGSTFSRSARGNDIDWNIVVHGMKVSLLGMEQLNEFLPSAA